MKYFIKRLSSILNISLPNFLFKFLQDSFNATKESKDTIILVLHFLASKRVLHFLFFTKASLLKSFFSGMYNAILVYLIETRVRFVTCKIENWCRNAKGNHRWCTSTDASGRAFSPRAKNSLYVSISAKLFPDLHVTSGGGTLSTSWLHIPLLPVLSFRLMIFASFGSIERRFLALSVDREVKY